MLEKIKEKSIILFIKQNQDEFNQIQKQFVNLFNKCGRKFNNQAMQLGFTAAVIGVMLKTTNISKEEKKKMLENLSKKLK